MRSFSRVVSIPAGAYWPDSESGLPLPWFKFWRVSNRAPGGSGNDLWVAFGGGRPMQSQGIISADEVVPAGFDMYGNLAGELAEEGDDQASRQLTILNVGSSAVIARVELDEEEIRVAPSSVFAGTTSVVSGNQTPGDFVNTPNDAVDVRAFLEAWNGAQWFRLWAQGIASDGINLGGVVGLSTVNLPMIFRGDGTYDRLRTPVTFKTAVASAAGNTAIWTPAAGKRFRLMAYSIEVTGNASMGAAGLNEITLNDAGAAIGQGVSAWFPAAAGTLLGNVQLSGGMRQLGNGVLSAAANNPLQVNLTTALTAGEVRVNAIGTEE